MVTDDISIDYERFLIKSMIIDDMLTDYNRFRLKIVFNRLFYFFLIEFNRFLAINFHVIKNNRAIFDYPMGIFLHGQPWHRGIL